LKRTTIEELVMAALSHMVSKRLKRLAILVARL